MLRAVTRPHIRQQGVTGTLSALRDALGVDAVTLSCTIDATVSQTMSATGDGTHLSAGRREPPTHSPFVKLDAFGVSGEVWLTDEADAAAADALRHVSEDLAFAIRRERDARLAEHDVARLTADSQRLRQVMGTAPEGIALVNRDGHVVAWNRALADLTHVPTSQALLQPFDTLLDLRDEDGRPLAVGPPGLRSARSGRRPLGRDVVRLRRGDSSIWLECSFAPTDEGSPTSGAVIVARDVTAERDVQRLKDDFLATVSHELRTPLTPIRGFVELLADADNVSPDVRRRVHAAASRQVDRLDRLVEDFVTAADLGANLVDGDRSDVDVALVVGTVIAGLESTEAARVTFRAEGSSAVATTSGRGLARVVDALIDNAVKHTAGTIDVRVSSRDGEVEVAVRDHGDGIAEEMIARVFEPFSRLGSHLHRPQGPGLGLTIAKAIADRLEAQLELESVPGRGTTVRLRIPAAPRSDGPGREGQVSIIDMAVGARPDRAESTVDP